MRNRANGRKYMQIKMRADERYHRTHASGMYAQGRSDLHMCPSISLTKVNDIT